jgi:putative photosynthetic complex assembly protein 2
VAGAVYGLVATAGDTTVTGAYAAFTCAVLVWGWNEMGFLMGYVTGPRPEPCPAGAEGFERFTYATMAILYHEVALVLSLLFITALTWDQPNQLGLWTFVVLWLMRLSSKVNVFLGVPNLTEEFLPAGLSFLKSYFRKASMNAAFPFSITISTVALVLLAQRGTGVGASAFDLASVVFLSTMLGLATLEHWLMVLPLPASALWAWGLKSHDATAAANASTATIEPGHKPAKQPARLVPAAVQPVAAARVVRQFH